MYRRCNDKVYRGRREHCTGGATIRCTRGSKKSVQGEVGKCTGGATIKCTGEAGTLYRGCSDKMYKGK